MKDQKELLWIGEEDLMQDQEWIEETQSEFHPKSIVEQLSEEASSSLSTNRRDFLKYLGFGVGAATVAAACEAPVKRAIPYVVKPEEIVPGVATYYASTFVEGGDYCPVLVKTREGRPIKIEGNDLSPMTGGGTSARAQASVLSLYDTNRYRNPFIGGEVVSWDKLDSEVKKGLASASNIRIVSRTVLSPSLKSAIDDFCGAYAGAKHIMYDAISSAAILRANEQNFGERVIPEYHFDKADVIASFDADFLGTWISPIEYARGYAANRRIDDVKNAKMSRHYQIESRMSMTGSNADHRILVKPSEQGAAIAYVYNKIVGGGSMSGLQVNAKAQTGLNALVKDLRSASGRSIVVSSSNNVTEQLMVNAINNALGNYGQTMSFAHASLQRQGDEKDLIDLIDEMKSGRVGALIVLDGNPNYDHPMAAAFAEAMSGVDMTISTSIQPNETSSACKFIAPDHHYLESWGDVEPKKGMLSFIQPTISPLFNTRQCGLSVLKWANTTGLDEEQPYLGYIKRRSENGAFAESGGADFSSFWNGALHNGVAELAGGDELAFSPVEINASSVTRPGSGLEVSLYESINVGDGNYATNPWLMEMPDPIMRTVWGNYVGVPIKFDGDRRYMAFANVTENGQYIGLNLKGNELNLPAFRLFGQMEETLSLALGYGRSDSGACANNIGTNAYHLVGTDNGLFQYFFDGAELTADAGAMEKDFACVQHHHTLGVKAVETATGEVINADEAELVDESFKWLTKGYQGSLTKRSIIRGCNLDELDHFVEELHHEREHHQFLNDKTLYPFEEYTEDKYKQGHHWGMHVDLNACTGCGACTVACMAENNVPVVGKTEVNRHHEMTWLRIDRYFYGDVENPNVVYQPMMCQHCDNAPCENVCPVNATQHSAEGLNHMAYNRCVGTRYCANNCPYKVRRFNWLDYTTADLFPVNEYKLTDEEVPFGADNLTRMVLNPDVTVRARGVIEKCSFCVQRLQEGKLNAKKEGRKLRDADVKSACQTACPTGAITFGDQNNEDGELSQKNGSPLNYIVLEEVNVQSSVQYSSKIVNKNKSLEG